MTIKKSDNLEEKAWFPTTEECEKFGMNSFEGYTRLQDALDLYPESEQDGTLAWELLNVSDVEEPNIY